jgi:hypothetical protein
MSNHECLMCVYRDDCLELVHTHERCGDFVEA